MMTSIFKIIVILSLSFSSSWIII